MSVDIFYSCYFFVFVEDVLRIHVDINPHFTIQSASFHLPCYFDYHVNCVLFDFWPYPPE